MRFRPGISAVALVLALAACTLWQDGDAPDSQQESVRRAALSDFHRQWRGVPYRYGGEGRGGMDCSGLVQTVFREVFAVALPRTTEAQADSGRHVSRSQLRAGDLVFFKTGWWKKHVGVYVGNGRFLHASETEGVTTTALSSPYWDDRFWQARRVM